ncbi:MAG: hypothetical protein NT149_02115 [Candidatus Gottesmanbacteria bacterium]|nr:hypothetical protein [Candidatus Gottesmanbacteria bacterium]
MQHRSVTKWLLAGIILAVFVETIQLPIDPDLGWHLRYGQYFFQTGHVLRENIISYVWPQYHWVQASWGYDLLLYQIFTHFSFWGLSVSAALLTVITFLILTWPIYRYGARQFLFLALMFTAIVSPIWGGGMRTPSLSTPFMAMAIVLGDRILRPAKHRLPAWVPWMLPFLFLVWANVHGGFALGLILLTIHLFGYGLLFILRRRTNISLILPDKRTCLLYGLVLLLSWITPLISPWGIRIYEETFKHTSNTNLAIISEWMPLWDMPIEMCVIGILTLATIIVMLLKKPLQQIPYALMLLVAIYLGVSANRFVIILGVLATYIMAQRLTDLRIPIFNTSWGKWVSTLCLAVVVPLDVFFFRRFFPPPQLLVFHYTWNDFCNVTLYCEEKITQLMLADPPKGNGFHPYNYGGYLAWRVPQVKTFIDGRMVAWEDHGKTPPAVEGDWIFMQRGPVAFRRFDSEYHFQWAIVPTNSDITDYLNTLVANSLWQNRYQGKLYSYFVKNP